VTTLQRRRLSSVTVTTTTFRPNIHDTIYNYGILHVTVKCAVKTQNVLDIRKNNADSCRCTFTQGTTPTSSGSSVHPSVRCVTRRTLGWTDEPELVDVEPKLKLTQLKVNNCKPYLSFSTTIFVGYRLITHLMSHVWRPMTRNLAIANR